MLTKIRRNKEFNTVSKNVIYLTVLNVVNYLFPILIIPYLTNVIGVELFGKFTFSYSILLYIAIFVMYGFDYSATRLVAIHKDSPSELSNVLSSVLTIRLSFALIATVLIVILVPLIGKLYEIRVLLYGGLGILYGLALFPVWLFQGQENMKYITIINTTTKTLAGILILVLIKDAEQFKFINIIYSISYILSGLIGLFFAFKVYKLKFVLPNYLSIKFQLKDGWSLFNTTVGMSVYRELNTIILGSLYDFTIVGYYTAAERIVKGVQVMISPFTQALYPYFSRKFNSEKGTANRHFAKIGNFYIAFLLIVALGIFFFASLICKILGTEFVESVINIRIMSIVIIFGGLNYFYGILGMVSRGYANDFSRIIWITGIFSVVFCFILSSFFADVGASLNLVLSEVILFALIIFSARSIKLKK